MAKAFPKSMGACADLLHTMKTNRLAADKAAAELKAQETALINHIIENLDKQSTGASGKTHSVRVVTKQKPQVKDWEAFYAYVAKTKAYDLFQRRLSEEAVFERLNAPKSKGVPGVELFNAVTVSLTKVK